MTYEDDIRRQEARKRLQARLERNGTVDSIQRDSWGLDETSYAPERTQRSDRSRRGDASYPQRERQARVTESERQERAVRQDYDDRESRRVRVDVPTRVGGDALRTASETAGNLVGRAREETFSLYDRFGTKFLIAAAAVGVVLLLIIILGIRGCVAGSAANNAATPSNDAAATSAEAASASAASASAASTDASTATTTTTTQAAPALSTVQALSAKVAAFDTTPIDENALKGILDDELAEKLIDASETDNDAHWIAAHPEAYLEDGDIVQFKLLRLAANEPAARPFVRAFPEKYPASAPDYNAPHTDENSNGVPRLYQWDQRWGYTEYCSTTFALTGCCPTSLAMVYQFLTGDTSKSPYDMAQLAVKDGYMTEYDGTDGSFLVYEAPNLGLNCMEIAVQSDTLLQAINSGWSVIVNVGEGDFTDGGHFFVVTGLDKDGNLLINDPFSAERSARSWDIEQIMNQTKALYAFIEA